jgi:hypothetical protein
MESYVETLMLMLRNKVLIEQGDLQRVKITWFYPISMAPKRLKNLRETWNNVEALMTIKDTWGGRESPFGVPFGYMTVPYCPSGQFNTSSRGCLSAPMNMVEMFYTDHGLPLNEDKAWMGSGQ